MTPISMFQDYIPEIVEGVSEFEAPLSPNSSYGGSFPVDEDYAKEPPMLPPQLHLTVLGSREAEGSSTKPQHVVLNHLFIEKGWASQSLVALGLTHRFQSKITTFSPDGRVFQIEYAAKAVDNSGLVRHSSKTTFCFFVAFRKPYS
ncbi:hypothetical protein GW17_00039474 [Ensete ventricosum]|nr:hypothetical protein GW17_00039474 [Ensete ventricosum]